MFSTKSGIYPSASFDQPTLSLRAYPMRWLSARLIGHWPLFVAIVFYFACVLALVAVGMSRSEGHFTYVLDDAYIHMAVAKNLMLHGVWGINQSEFSSASSSILYPLLLAAVFRLIGLREWLPLAINLVFGAITVLVAYRVLKGHGLKSVAVAGVLLFLVGATPMPIVTLTGMEHLLQAAATVAFVALAAEVVVSDTVSGKSAVYLAALAALVTGIRYEGMFLLAITCVLLVLRKRWKVAFLCAIVGMLPVVVFGFISMRHGSYFFPNPLLMKSKFEHIALWDITKLVYYALRNMQEPHILVLCFGALVAIAIRARNGDLLRSSKQVMLLLFIGSTAMHLTFAQIGWAFRYEAYLVATGIVVIAAGVSGSGGALPLRIFDRASPVYSAAVGLAALALVAPFAFRTGSAMLGPQAMENIYEQHFQVARFIDEYYNGQAVLANDVGVVSYLPTAHIVDLVGLGTADVTRIRRQGRFSNAWLKKYVKAKDVRLAVVHDSWFAGSEGLPVGWERVGTWTVYGHVPFTAKTVSFFSVDSAETAALRQRFHAFSTRRLPARVAVREY